MLTHSYRLLTNCIAVHTFQRCFSMQFFFVSTFLHLTHSVFAIQREIKNDGNEQGIVCVDVRKAIAAAMPSKLTTTHVTNKQTVHFVRQTTRIGLISFK